MSSSSTAPPGHESAKNTSFLHLLYLHKLQWLFIYGTTSTPQSTTHLTGAYRHPWSSQTHAISIWQKCPSPLISSRYSTKYIRHFSCAAYVSFKDLTWAGILFTSTRLEHSHPSTQTGHPSTQTGLPVDNNTDRPPYGRYQPQVAPPCVDSSDVEPELQRVWMIKFMTLLWGSVSVPITHPIPIRIVTQDTLSGFDVSGIDNRALVLGELQVPKPH